MSLGAVRSFGQEKEKLWRPLQRVLGVAEIKIVVLIHGLWSSPVGTFN